MFNDIDNGAPNTSPINIKTGTDIPLDWGLNISVGNKAPEQPKTAGIFDSNTITILIIVVIALVVWLVMRKK